MNARRVTMAVALTLLASGGVTDGARAAGLEPGVHIDPESPAAKEYALPLSQGRQTGAGSGSSGTSETPFGAGIKPPKSGGSGGSSARKTGRRHAERGTSGQAGAGGSQPTLPPAVQRAVTSRGSSGGGGSLPALIGGGVAILVLGGFGGTVLRHSRRPTPSG
jgi:hypothetical protein